MPKASKATASESITKKLQQTIEVVTKNMEAAAV
jgi:hypothetical protein